MNAVTVNAVMDIIEEDHRLVLKKTQALKDAVDCLLLPGDQGLREALHRLQRLNLYFASHFAFHTEEEERVLFPFLERNGSGGVETVAGLKRQHAEIQRKREELGNCLSVADDLEGGPPRMVIADLVGYGLELWDLLDAHAREESRAVHECVRAALMPGKPSLSGAGMPLPVVGCKN
ncbi:MAG TPA: hemerythrin domain-containing protein [Gemmataceae bacterium]|jgi:hemerythrin-like domain-containing protein|nr:hemerythrin domain-containing protein [Gemmataceae bacterium]